MKYVSLFAGIGGFDLALNRLGHECVYVNEWDKYAAQTYEKNFGHKPDTTSITDVPASAIPDHDLLVGGFPCQAFSVAGKRKGFDEARGTLFFDIARILKHHQTKYFILENVKGLLSHDSGRTFRVIIKTLTELGYDLQWQVLNSKNFGVPQNRERVFIVGNFRGQSRPQVFPIGGEIGETTASRDVAGTLQADYWKRDRTGGYVIEAKQRVRLLTPIEAERLQGFPDNWTAGVSDTQRYKQLGNAVTVNVVYEVAKRLSDKESND